MRLQPQATVGFCIFIVVSSWHAEAEAASAHPWRCSCGLTWRMIKEVCKSLVCCRVFSIGLLDGVRPAISIIYLQSCSKSCHVAGTNGRSTSSLWDMPWHVTCPPIALSGSPCHSLLLHPYKAELGSACSGQVLEHCLHTAPKPE